MPYFVITQLRAQLKAISDSGFEVYVITSQDESSLILDNYDFISYQMISIPRKIEFLKDLVAVFRLFWAFSTQKYQIVHSTTPKAGLLCAIAGFCANVPIRLHTYTGQPWATATGVKRRLFILADQIIALLNTQCYADSQSQKSYLLENSIGSPTGISVIGPGSVAGVDQHRFSLEALSPYKEKIKTSLKIPQEAFVILFVGRITKDKGIVELFEAFERLSDVAGAIFLVLVGPIEEDCVEVVQEALSGKCATQIRMAGFTDTPEHYMAAADLLCLPSYREGFGTVVIESAMLGLPTVASEIYGLQDSVLDGETGILVPKANADELFLALKKLFLDSEFRLKLGQQARKRAQQEFSSETINQLVINEYQALCMQQGLLE